MTEEKKPSEAGRKFADAFARMVFAVGGYLSESASSTLAYQFDANVESLREQHSRELRAQAAASHEGGRLSRDKEVETLRRELESSKTTVVASSEIIGDLEEKLEAAKGLARIGARFHVVMVSHHRKCFSVPRACDVCDFIQALSNFERAMEEK